MSAIEYVVYSTLVCLSIMIVPGQIFFLTIQEASRSRRDALMMGLGIAAAEIVLLLLLFTGFSTILYRIVPVLRITGAIFLFILGSRSIARSLKPTTRKKVEGSLAPFNRGFLMTALNPPFIVWLFTAGLSTLDTGAALGLMGYLIFASALLGSSLAVVLFLIFAISISSHYMGGPVLRFLYLVSGLAFLALGLSLLYQLLTYPQ
ncbi:MAG: LysE family transporter [Nitrososphaerota archaeon]